MTEILEIYGEKLVQNLLSNQNGSIDAKTEKYKVVEMTLDVFSLYSNNTISCRMLSKVPIV